MARLSQAIRGCQAIHRWPGSTVGPEQARQIAKGWISPSPPPRQRRDASAAPPPTSPPPEEVASVERDEMGVEEEHASAPKGANGMEE